MAIVKCSKVQKIFIGGRSEREDGIEKERPPYEKEMLVECAIGRCRRCPLRIGPLFNLGNTEKCEIIKNSPWHLEELNKGK